MNEVTKLYENAGVNKIGIKRCSGIKQGICQHNCNECESFDYKYPPFTAEKQLEIENVVLQNKKNYNKWIEYNINVYGEWVIRFVRTNKFAPYIALGKTRAEAFAKVINNLWQDLTEEERKQIKEILE